MPQLSSKPLYVNASPRNPVEVYAYGSGTVTYTGGTLTNGQMVTLSSPAYFSTSGTASIQVVNVDPSVGVPDSVNLTGTPTAVTPAADSNNSQVATTGYVAGQAAAAAPAADGTAAVGTSPRFARQDHVHPTDSTRAPLASPTFTGTPAAPTAAVGTSTTQIATMAAVTAASSQMLGNVQTASYTPVLTDAGKAIELNSASATTVTIPPNSSVAYPVGTVIEVSRYGAGTVTIAAGAGVTIRNPGSVLTLRAQYSSVSLRQRATDEWVISGDVG